MLNSLPVVLLLGTALGLLSGLGVGGGSLLILWLTLVLRMEPEKARILNLLFFIPTAIIATLFRGKQQKVPVRKLLPGMIGGCVSVAGFSLFSQHLDRALLQKIFGILFLLTGTRELLYKPKKDSTK